MKQVDGVLEGWIWKMAAALKSQHKQINVIIADWLTSAHQHYPIAVRNTRYIGQEIAGFLEWLEVRTNFIFQLAHVQTADRVPRFESMHTLQFASC